MGGGKSVEQITIAPACGCLQFTFLLILDRQKATVALIVDGSDQGKRSGPPDLFSLAENILEHQSDLTTVNSVALRTRLANPDG